MMRLKVLVGDREFLITNLTKEVKILAGAQVYTGRLLMHLTNGKVVALPPGVAPRMPCRTCGIVKPLNEPCERTPKCAAEQAKAESLIAGMHRREPESNSLHVS